MSAGAVSALPRFALGLEEGVDGHVTVHAFAAPCRATGASVEEALSRFETELAQWLNHLRSIGEAVPDRQREIELSVEEWIRTDVPVGLGASNVCFDRDRVPVGREEVERELRLLGMLRSRLLGHVRRARNEQLEAVGTAEHNVKVVIDELARAHWWTLTRLGASPLAEVPERVVARLDTSMALLVQAFTELPAERLESSIVLDDEEWTARKVLRRVLWLEWSLGSAALDLLRSQPLASR